ncbi:MAG TPA: Gfo/Idh/MocA family oxidoreductase [Victivallales bacterium]|nr:Gfo/Idh/MocA family oxidoreductase [Victivallales bacterium]
MQAKEWAGYEPEGCHPKELISRMTALSVSELIVTTIDSFHDEYICMALENGFDVITEKPMTIDEKKCKRILETQKKTGRKVRVTFNYRYAPVRSQVKELLMTGIIGDILSVDFHWMLNLSHGADYFRRWHRWKKNSGGLMVHKATHHFDLVNWWLNTVPERVFASGDRKFYRPETAGFYGLKNRSERCLDCPEKKKCNFYFDLNKTASLRELYLKNEKFDGYFRDRCVFSSDMDIEDCMNVIVDYKNGTKMSYSLNAFVSWEGYIISFNGTRGRLEHKCEESVYTSGDESVQGALRPEGTWIKIYPNWKPAYSVEIKKSEGGHGGGDPIMLSDIFEPEKQSEDKLKRAADHRSGAWSILTGIAANHSMKKHIPIKIEELVDNLELP